MAPNVYIVAGPNGAGKTTLAGKGYVRLLKYQPLLDFWAFFDNSTDMPRMIAFKRSGKLQIIDSDVFSMIADDMEIA